MLLWNWDSSSRNPVTRPKKDEVRSTNQWENLDRRNGCVNTGVDDLISAEPDFHIFYLDPLRMFMAKWLHRCGLAVDRNDGCADAMPTVAMLHYLNNNARHNLDTWVSHYH
jgi:hypothetical protein